MNSIVFGTFGAERYWADPDAAGLPRLTVSSGESDTEAMDELLVGLCGPADILCTRCEVPQVLREYHRFIGLVCEHRTCLPAGRTGPVCDLLRSPENRPWMAAAIAEGYQFRCWAVIPTTAALLRDFDSAAALPDIEVVRRVNSKLWSFELRARLGVPFGTRADSAAAFAERGGELLRSGPIVVKEADGVSGGGSAVVETSARLARLARHLRDEEARGRQVGLVLEPYLGRAFDFSVQFEVAPDGRFLLVGYHGMRNRGTVYVASHPLGDDQLAVLAGAGVPAVVERIAAALAAENYRGPAGIDGMVAADGTIVPVLEINARATLGLVNLRLDEQFRKCGRRSYLTALKIPAGRAFEIGDALAALRASDLLHDPGYNPDGVVPLTATAARCGGRVFVAAPYNDLGEVGNRVAQAERVLAEGWL